MKTKIAEALKTKYKSFGLSNEAWDRIASAKQETVTKEEDIEAGISDVATMDLIAKELQKMRDSEIQKRTDLQREHDDYKAKHPENKEDKHDDGDDDKVSKSELSQLIKDATAAAVADVTKKFEDFKAASEAKDALANAKNAFFENKWTSKFADEANDAWERVLEVNEAKGGSMSKDDIVSKCNEYFNKAVKRKGVDATQPFKAEDNHDGNFDFSADAKALEDDGLLEKSE